MDRVALKEGVTIPQGLKHQSVVHPRSTLYTPALTHTGRAEGEREGETEGREGM